MARSSLRIGRIVGEEIKEVIEHVFNFVFKAFNISCSYQFSQKLRKKKAPAILVVSSEENLGRIVLSRYLNVEKEDKKGFLEKAKARMKRIKKLGKDRLAEGSLPRGAIIWKGYIFSFFSSMGDAFDEVILISLIATITSSSKKEIIEMAGGNLAKVNEK